MDARTRSVGTRCADRIEPMNETDRQLKRIADALERLAPLAPLAPLGSPFPIPVGQPARPWIYKAPRIAPTPYTPYIGDPPPDLRPYIGDSPDWMTTTTITCENT